MKSIDYLKEEYHEGRHWMLDDRSQIVVNLFKKYAKPTDRILELGCSSGRNLIALNKAGFKNLTGLEMFPVKQRDEFQLIRGRWEEVDLEEYDIVFSASFLQEFESFPQGLFNQTLQKTKKYFMIFGDLMPKFNYPNFEIIEKINPIASFSQPIIILKCLNIKE